jgi:UDP-N-acetylmuramyl pentapeptide phosphotransferase/UDP-N-acetylglucosamine-1-phosphate transferase
MHALPFLLALLSAAVLAPAVLRTLAEGGHTRLNYRERPLPFPFGVLVVAAALIALIPLVLLARLASSEVFHPELLPIALYALGVATLGLIDDTLGEARAGLSVASDMIDQSARPGGDVLEEPPQPAPRGWRGHARAALRGELSTGTLKAAGSLGLALFAMSFEGLSRPGWLLAVGVLVLATNVFNLLDLRPGRAIKAFVLLGAGLTLGSLDARPLWSLGLFVAPALVAGLYDLRERAMLGDTGANLLGALAGLWLVLTLSQSGQLIALALLVAVTLYGELRSISALVERTPGLRALDSFGRPS